MKKEYTSPELEIIKFSTEDVIVTSMTGNKEGDIGGSCTSYGCIDNQRP